ncbi:LysR family transcriptional regulator [Variovorax sp.]|jgi:DNA-binding transcriptional LysR family regulator|uniref:LysR family transcriptional regulator n=1 Tax=Variovorax sp. TaxID=1871043 RepID=UPI000C594F78|nr:LysR family transcriptional regulator [Variovorax sp.]MBS80752.1 hypothetical protein [Variovorax sp.]
MVSEKRTIDTQLLRTFVMVAKYLSITAAADSLGLAKSAVSKQLGALESQLQVRLLERASRRVSLTNEGRMLLPRAESILAELEHFINDAQQELAQVRGTVRISASPEFGAFLAAHFFPALLQQHAALKVVMSLQYRYDDLHDPVFDLAFRLGSLQDDRLVGRLLGEFSRVLVCGANDTRSRALNEPADLAAANVLVFSNSDLEESWVLERVAGAQRRHEIKVHGRLGVQGFEALRAAASAGLGIARLPLFVATPGLADGTLVRVLQEWQSPPVPVYLAFRPGVSRVGRVRAVIDAAARMLPALLQA